jgi:hypothetical protein
MKFFISEKMERKNALIAVNFKAILQGLNKRPLSVGVAVSNHTL